MTIEPYRVHAYNTAKQSENKMHDDTVAKRFGFSGGLVPGALTNSTRGTSTRRVCSSRNRITRGTRK